MIRIVLAVSVLAALVGDVLAQSATTRGGNAAPTLMMCWNGVTNSDGTLQVVPCSISSPLATSSVGTVNTAPSPQAPFVPPTVTPKFGRTGSPW